MAGSINKVILIGNLGQNPETRFNNENGKIVTFSMATSESWKDKTTGERRDRVEWHRIVVFNEKLAEICEKYLKKGSKIYIEGQLQTRRWIDEKGYEHFKTEVVLKQYRGEITMLDTRNREESEELVVDKEPWNNVVNMPLNDEVPF